MPRPRKCRRVQGPPRHTRFGPEGCQGKGRHVVLHMDEYETIRLIDALKHTQQEAADMMEVSRSTVQTIYDKAREKIANALVNGYRIHIEGGDVEFAQCEKRFKKGKGNVHNE
ncbi:MAG: DUF134 domain-containing protein [Bacillota bacterium]